MANEKQLLKVGDKVIVKALGARGVVTIAHHPPPAEDELYQVQIAPRFFRRDDLELDTSDADRAKHQKAIEEKAAAVDVAWQNLHQAVTNGDTLNVELLRVYAVAESELRKEQGIPSLILPLLPLFMPPTKQ
jgi:hypothetical protein